MAIPAAPANVVVQQGNGQVFISWDISAGATSYSVQRSTDNVTFSALATPAVAQYTDTTGSIGTEYWYQVAAVNGSGTSGYTAGENSIVPSISGNDCLGSLRLQAQQRADRVNSNFVTKSEWDSYINQSYFELYDLLVTTYEDYYLAEPYVFQTDGTSTNYALPNGQQTDVNGVQTRPYYKLMGVDLGLANNDNAWVTVKKFDFIQRNRYVYPNITSTYMGVFNMRYRVLGNKLHFIPTPSAGQYIKVWYVPRMERLLKDTDMADGVSGWTEYIIVDAAIKALQKEESDVTALMMQKQALIDRIQSSAMNRDAGQPDTISSTRNDSSGSWGSGGGFDGSWGGL